MLQSLIDLQIKTRRVQETLERDNRKFRISDAGRCHLYRYWKREGKPIDDTASSNGYRAMELGIMIHNLIESLLHENPSIDVYTEGEIETEHLLGHYDCLIKTQDKRTILYDIKTLSGKSAWYAKNNGQPIKKHHLYQIITYAKYIDPLPNEIRIAYVNCENLEVVSEEETPYNMFIFRVWKDWEMLLTAWECQKTPKANPEPWECRYCPYSKDCQFAIA